jgi:hypothetical protein
MEKAMTYPAKALLSSRSSKARRPRGTYKEAHLSQGEEELDKETQPRISPEVTKAREDSPEQMCSHLEGGSHRDASSWHILIILLSPRSCGLVRIKESMAGDLNGSFEWPRRVARNIRRIYHAILFPRLVRRYTILV